VAALNDIESKLFTARDFRLENGQSLPVLELAYETYGTPSEKRDNAVLAVHGYTSSHHAPDGNDSGQAGRGVAARRRRLVRRPDRAAARRSTTDRRSSFR
jgi:homoserine O-acetyltransferase